MKKIVLTALALCGIMSAKSQSQNWQLIWSDEFNGQSLDLTKWSFETGTGVNGDWGTGQLDRATDRPENVSIEQGIQGADGGALRITTRKEHYIDREYTSGRINSMGKASWGPNHRIVARVWPQDVRTMGQGFAFWMMPDEIPDGADHISWPQGGEIDIMEYVGSIPRHNLGSVHYAWDWNGNEWADWNHGHHGGYYSFEEQQVPDSPEYLRVDLGQVYNINQVIINWENTGKTFAIETSLNGTTWNPVYTTNNGAGGMQTIDFGNTNARFVRMNGTQRSNDWGYSIFEFQVFGDGTGNLALNKSVTASSSQGDDVGASFAVDGDNGSRWSSSLRDPQYQCCDQSPTSDPNVGANNWHEYGINWYSDRMEFFIDNNVYHIHYFNDGAAFDLDGENESAVVEVNGRNVKKTEFSNLYSEWHPFEHKMYAILSAGVGGGGQTYGGPIVDQAQFPTDVYVDWVRVYSNGEEFNAPPSVGFTSPTSLDTYPAPANITLTAQASDRDGTVTSVSFYDGDQLIGTDNSAPFSFNWTNVSAGVHTIKAVATDNGGATGYTTLDVAVNGAGANLALNRPGTASSVTGNFSASQAFDGDVETRWESAYADPQWIYVDLGNTYAVERVKIIWETAKASNYRIEISNDKTNWTLLKSVTGNTDLQNEFSDLSGSGRYVRMYGSTRTTSYGYSIFSMEVYGQGSGDGGGDDFECGTSNLALGKTYAASSAEGAFTAASAFDGDGGTRWGSGFNDNEWIRVDLGSSHHICQVTLVWEAAYGSAYEIRLGNSADVNAAQVIASVNNGDGGTDNVTTDSAPAGRYLFMQGVSRATGYGYSLWEMEAYGALASASRISSEVPANQSLMVFPNPVQQILNISATNASEAYEIEIMNIVGEIMKVQKMSEGQSSIDVSDLTAGIYFLRYKGQESKTIRFIKQ